MNKTLILGLITASAFSVNAQNFTEEQCLQMQVEQRIEPITAESLKSAMIINSISPNVATCVYPELVVTPKPLNEIEHIDDWEQGIVGVTLSSRIHYKLGNFEGERAVLETSKGHKLEVTESSNGNQYVVTSLRTPH
ncbi:hypothetical protein [Moritella sp. F3]|uniref:hypothetical protein n=1 Tax=Moritella sp. F3 TaxID=2718882 RepID=UPI0018E0C5F6|nr:hypothetical protein [Moritella sp. F3]GIC77152.1 hypothetical protein FMO001_18790 [Moritella sp. F1]GIC82271.1 hypothetical protein FMO003_25520 [Moritella sp. F3]